MSSNSKRERYPLISFFFFCSAAAVGGGTALIHKALVDLFNDRLSNTQAHAAVAYFVTGGLIALSFCLLWTSIVLGLIGIDKKFEKSTELSSSNASLPERHSRYVS